MRGAAGCAGLLAASGCQGALGNRAACAACAACPAGAAHLREPAREVVHHHGRDQRLAQAGGQADQRVREKCSLRSRQAAQRALGGVKHIALILVLAVKTQLLLCRHSLRTRVCLERHVEMGAICRF